MIKENQLLIGLCAIGLGIYLGLTNDDHRGNFVTGFMENSIKPQENIRTEFDACMDHSKRTNLSQNEAFVVCTRINK